MTSAVLVEEEIFEKTSDPTPVAIRRVLPVADVDADVDEELLEFGLDLKALKRKASPGLYLEGTDVSRAELDKHLAHFPVEKVVSRTSAMQALTILREARAYIAAGWVKGMLASTGNKSHTSVEYWRASEFCVLGALARAKIIAFGDEGPYAGAERIAAEAMTTVARLAGFGSIPSWNDSAARTQNEILHGFDVGAALIRARMPSPTNIDTFAKADEEAFASI
jgi:hypothetical protein